MFLAQLLHPLCWSAQWLDHRVLFFSSAQYRTLLRARIGAIRC